MTTEMFGFIGLSFKSCFNHVREVSFSNRSPPAFEEVFVFESHVFYML